MVLSFWDLLQYSTKRYAALTLFKNSESKWTYSQFYQDTLRVAGLLSQKEERFVRILTDQPYLFGVTFFCCDHYWKDCCISRR